LAGVYQANSTSVEYKNYAKNKINEEEIEGLYTEEKMSAKNHAGHVSSE